MIDVTGEDLLAYFARRSNRFQNTAGMEFGYGERNGIWTTFNLCNYKHGPTAIDISTENDHPEEFIEWFKVKSLQDIDKLEYNNSWMRYLNGQAIISITPLELEATLDFKIIKGKTIVFSLDLHFYDEVYEHLTLPEDFDQYVSTRQRQLGAATANRYKF